MTKFILVFAALLLLILWQGQAVSAKVVIVGGLTHEKVAEKGEEYKGIILLRNPDDEPADVRLYQTDYTFNYEGKSDYGDPGTKPRSNASWLTLSPTRVTIAPKETVEVNYIMKVPKNDEMNGTFWSIIMVEPIASAPAPDTAKTGKEKVKMGIVTIIRYGIQIITNIGDTGERKLKFLDRKLISKEGRTLFQVDVENNGDRAMVPSIYVELYNKGGAFVGKFESLPSRIYPGCSIRSLIDLSGIPKGDYKALLVADNGDEHVFGAEYTLSIK
ncbi:MAG: hypothetical protein AB2L14_00080 [Candidatus Xenobiia bacterium LiM19]